MEAAESPFSALTWFLWSTFNWRIRLRSVVLWELLPLHKLLSEVHVDAAKFGDEGVQTV